MDGRQHHKYLNRRRNPLCVVKCGHSWLVSELGKLAYFVTKTSYSDRSSTAEMAEPPHGRWHRWDFRGQKICTPFCPISLFINKPSLRQVIAAYEDMFDAT
jgi:hypothetical protein